MSLYEYTYTYNIRGVIYRRVVNLSTHACRRCIALLISPLICMRLFVSVGIENRLIGDRKIL